jgi:hypothetical protein
VSCAACITSATYLHWRLHEARALPWSLLQGDWVQNLTDLQAGARPLEENAAKMWEGLHAGLPMSVYLDILGFMWRAGWAANGTEQAHVLSTGMLRLHRDMGVENLQSRSMISAMRPLVTKSNEEKQLDRARNHLHVQNRRRPQNFTGRQLYLKDLNAQSDVWREQGRDVAPDVADAIMRKHGLGWRALSRARQEDYEARAKDEREHMAAENLDEKAATVKRIEELKALVEKSRSADNPILLSQCKFNDADMIELQAEFDKAMYTKNAVDEARCKAAEVVGPPVKPVRQLLESVELPSHDGARPRPPWTALLANNRDFFQDCAIRVLDPAGERIFKYTLGIQKPYLVGFLELFSEPEPCIDLEEDDGPHRAALDMWANRFKIDLDKYFYSDAWPFAFDLKLEVLTGVIHLGHGNLASHVSRWKPLEEIAEMLPSSSQSAPADRTPEQPEVDHRWLECPWLLDFLATGEQKEPKGRSSPAKADGLKHEIDALMVMDALYAARQEWELRSRADTEDFRWQLLGGRWLAETRGLAFDSFMSSARNKEAKQFCVDWALGKQSSYAVSWYQDMGAFMLATAWSHKMQFFYDELRLQGDALVDFTEASARYIEPLEFTDWPRDAPARAQLRIQQIRDLKPKRHMA